MARYSFEQLSFRRTLLLLILLVALPAAGLSGFGVLAIINERAAVQKRIEVQWLDRLAQVAQRLERELRTAKVEPLGEGLRVSSRGVVLSENGFRVEGEDVVSRDSGLQQAVRGILPALNGIGPSPVLFSISTPNGPLLLIAAQAGGAVLGAHLSTHAVEELARALSDRGAEPVRLELQAVSAEPTQGVVGKLVSEVEHARAALESAPPLARLRLPAPMEQFELIAQPLGEDPVALASTRNRALYGVLLGVFYLVLALGVFYTARALYREARLSRLKTDFVSLVSHELRTPLTSIRMFIETLSLGRIQDQEQAREVLSLLARETERLSAMIDRVLDWARIESGRKDYHLESVSVDDVLATTVEAFRAQRLEGAARLRLEVEPALPKVSADIEAVSGALLNLLNNAYKYSAADAPIVLRARREGDEAAIEVIDQGVGISARDRKKIFDRFYRVDNLLTRKTEGSGLGLSIAQRIAEAHGGVITVDSEPGKGSTFTLQLPFVKADNA